MARGNDVTVMQQATQVRGNAFQQELEGYKANFVQMLPAHVPVERFMRVVMTAVGSNPDLLYANRRTLYIAAGRCATDGLMPDGREAALVVYNTEVKQRDPDTGLDHKVRMDVVQFMPMIAGIRKRMRNSGDIVSATAEAVYLNDDFDYELGDEPFIKHKPAGLGKDRGGVIGAYAIIKLRNGEVLRDVMDKATVELARKVSRAPNGPMWANFYHEGAKKTVLRRCAKGAPQSAELEGLLSHEEEPPLLDEFPSLPAPPPPPRQPEPQRLAPAVIAHDVTPPPAETGIARDSPQFAVVDMDGQELIFHTPEAAAKAIELLFGEAAKIGLGRLQGARETNAPTIEALAAFNLHKLAEGIDAEYNRLHAELMPPQEPVGSPPVQVSAAPASPPPQSRSPAPAPAAAAAPPFPGDMPTPPAPAPPPPGADGDRGLRTILVPTRGNKPDYKTWTIALFLPKVRAEQDLTQLAFLVGDNDETLKAARQVLSAAEMAEVDATVDAQWKAIG